MREIYDETFFKGRVYPDYTAYKHIHKKRAEWLQSLGVRGNVLELGCAFGYMVEAMRNLGMNATGIDISAYAVKQANSKYVTQENLKALDFGNGDYDYIVSFNCLDNILSPDKESALIAANLNTSKAQQIHVVVTEGMFMAHKFFHQIILKPSSHWTKLYPNAKIVCFACWKIYQYGKEPTEEGNWY